jgi:Ca2+-binding RTX toxin-like protein
MNADGTNQQRVTVDPAQDDTPAWSPDGQKITFVSGRDGGNFEVYIVNADGTGPVVNLTNNPAFEFDTDWQPISSGSSVCTRIGTTLTISMTTASSMTVGLSGASFNVISNGVPDATCASSTVNNVDRVNVNGTSGSESLTLDLSGGQFSPGFTPEGSGISEIEFQLDLGAGNDALVIQGGAGVESIRLGSGGINVNGDDDADLALAGLERATVKGGGGNDKLFGKGGLGTGSAFALPLTLNGEAGNDRLTDGLAADLVDGGPGNDTLTTLKNADAADDYAGGQGTDTLSYGPRAQAVTVSTDGQANDGALGEADNARPDIEKLTGGKGDDTLSAKTQAKETLKGGNGNDTLNVQDGNSLDVANGGLGTADTCLADPGDTKLNCEA